MDSASLIICVKYLSMAIAIGIGVFGPGLGIGIATMALLESIARQPEIKGELFKDFIIGAGLVEACAIYALLTVLLIAYAIK